ncbi:MAG: hypothetical protein L0L22_10975, partial [Staphylococcus equorum]|nr:hypothetical protein [Staphylococcus equorum]
VQETWSMLHENKGKKIIINDKLELQQFEREFNYILDNIQGNLNYGKAFVSVVEDTFELE